MITPGSSKETEPICESPLFKIGTVQLHSLLETKRVMHVQSCCFANLNLLLFCRSRFRRCRRCLSSLLSNHVRRKQLSGPIKSQSKNVCLLFFSLACDVIAFLFFAFYSFLGGQFMASNGWTLIPIYLTVSKFSYINRMILVKEHDKRCYQWQTG